MTNQNRIEKLSDVLSNMDVRSMMENIKSDELWFYGKNFRVVAKPYLDPDKDIVSTLPDGIVLKRDNNRREKDWVIEETKFKAVIPRFNKDIFIDFHSPQNSPYVTVLSIKPAGGQILFNRGDIHVLNVTNWPEFLDEFAKLDELFVV